MSKRKELLPIRNGDSVCRKDDPSREGTATAMVLDQVTGQLWFVVEWSDGRESTEPVEEVRRTK